ncbi:MAG: SPOR domain-containing protein [Nitrosomonas sp.]|uniref:SPOR domain-containing protein n=1 Tax=Nitrosomonas sp. TaxID=42353 RepID=UPI00272606DD|nr:SPOR domain-containing protein [Nitrosomonas sp.]MDO8894957.1 SPOR domain-containing protein [Nitrosomonas sp.]MDO9469816.1 SPOR domain-containing protein [Nitrosomonas sp.]MDP1787105.1 SPOR domain-containing protein [Nitrosomonas sp.]MDP2224277.1 SPOR domain-containing protein [Nitrosomonas sp.]
MTKNISEEELLLRKRARRRLVGAIILVLISVTVLPIIFDEPKSENEKHEIAINLPIPNQNDRNSFAPKAESVDRESTHGVDALPESQSKPKDTPQNVEESIEVSGEQKRIPIPGIKPKINKHPAELKNTAAANIAAAVAVTTPATTAADTTKGFVVQLGAFSDQLKAKQQQANLASNGFKAYTETLKIDNNEVTRVRIGPFMGRSAAENELKKLKKIGLDGVVVPR